VKRVCSVASPCISVVKHSCIPAFVCDTCGRRFGVNSNLNRHVKRCILRNAAQDAVDEFAESLEPTMRAAQVVDPSSSSMAIASSRQAPPESAGSTKRKTTTSLPLPSPDHPTQSPQPPPKRRRRAPSPNHWVPASLLPFNLFSIESNKSTPVPLTPVYAYRDPKTNEWIEERDSWDENVGATPYHPCSWKGRLPGPGFGGKDVGNLPGDAFVMGRLVLT